MAWLTMMNQQHLVGPQFDVNPRIIAGIYRHRCLLRVLFMVYAFTWNTGKCCSPHGVPALTDAILKLRCLALFYTVTPCPFIEDSAKARRLFANAIAACHGPAPQPRAAIAWDHGVILCREFFQGLCSTSYISHQTHSLWVSRRCQYRKAQSRVI